MKSRKKGRMGSMAVKLDISKAYDKLEWDFLESMMRRLEFNEGWISKIMTCVKSMSYVVLVNGQPDPRFTHSRRFRQCDPISPYLYIIYAEDLSSLLNEAERSSKIKGVEMAHGSPSINHIFFVENSIVFLSGYEIAADKV